MDSNIRIFHSEQFGDIRTAGTPENPLFCLTDLCKALELKKVSRVKDRLNKRGVTLVSTPTFNQHGAEVMQDMSYVNEQNMYLVIMRSDKPQAEPFQDWVCGEVLPTIRKTGGYMVTTETMTDEEIMARALNIANDTIRRRDERIAQLEGVTEEQQKVIEQKDAEIEVKDETIKAQTIEIKDALPKKQYTENILLSESTMNTTQVAKTYGMTGEELNKKLRDAGIQYKQGDMWLLKVPYARWNLTKTRTHPFMGSDGTQRTNTYTVWNERGRFFIDALHRNDFDVKAAISYIKGQRTATGGQFVEPDDSPFRNMAPAAGSQPAQPGF